MYSITSNNRAFTLLEILVVLAIIGLLAATILPSYSNYLQRGRDSTRVTDIDTLAKSLTLYFSENSAFPAADAGGCINDSALSNYVEGRIVHDPISYHENGCTPGQYGYAMTTLLANDPSVYSILAIMEQPFSGNYSGSLDGFTGTLTAAAYNTGLTLTSKGQGQNYVRIF